MLQDMGMTKVSHIDSGFNGWKDAGKPWARPRTLGPAERNRYQRHLLLPEVGEEGQLALLDAKVLLLGAGGLGSPAALYLAAAGVGTLGIVDMDEVDESNLQRQIIHRLDRVGERKVDSARTAIHALNPVLRRQLSDAETGVAHRNLRSVFNLEQFDLRPFTQAPVHCRSHSPSVEPTLDQPLAGSGCPTQCGTRDPDLQSSLHLGRLPRAKVDYLVDDHLVTLGSRNSRPVKCRGDVIDEIKPARVTR